MERKGCGGATAVLPLPDDLMTFCWSVVRVEFLPLGKKDPLLPPIRGEDSLLVVSTFHPSARPASSPVRVSPSSSSSALFLHVLLQQLLLRRAFFRVRFDKFDATSRMRVVVTQVDVARDVVACCLQLLEKAQKPSLVSGSIGQTLNYCTDN